MRDLSNRTAPYILFDAELAVRPREPKNLYEKTMARLAKTTYVEKDPSFFRTLDSLNFRGEYNIGILVDHESAHRDAIWDALTDDLGHPIYRVIDGRPSDVDFIEWHVRHFFSRNPVRYLQSRVGMTYEQVWSVLS